jgi:hypothetical protein
VTLFINLLIGSSFGTKGLILARQVLYT